MPADGSKNLKKISSTEEAKKLGKKGGIKSGQVRKERAEIRKAMTQVYQDVLKNPDLDLDDAIIKIIGQKNSASVSMMKEIREALEGNKIKLASDEVSPLNITITPVKVKE
jgi:hypothetical protein